MPSSCRPARRRMLSLQLPAEFVIVFEPVTHAAHFIDVKGEPTKERQNLSLIFNKVQHADGTRPRCGPGPLRLSLENRSDGASLPAIWIAGDDAARPARQAAAVPDRQAPAHQPDLPRHLPHRHARRRPAARRSPASPSCSPTSRARPSSTSGSATSSPIDLVREPFPRAARDRRRGGRRGGQDHRRRGDGDVPDARPRASPRRCACARRCAASTASAATRTCCSRSASTRARASR